MTQCSLSVREEGALPLILFNYIIDWILGQSLQVYLEVQVGATVHVHDLANADDIVILSRFFRKMQSLIEAVNRLAAAIGILI